MVWGFAAPFVEAVRGHEAAALEDALAEGWFLQDGFALGVDDGGLGPGGLEAPTDFFGDELAGDDVDDGDVLGGRDVVAFFQEDLEFFL